jgi:ABC-2 type transport system permease protein
MEFRTNFILGIVRHGIWISAFLFMIEIIFRNTASLNGWDHAEVLIVLALSRLIEGTMDTFVTRNIALLPHTVQRGELDLLLLKPLPSQFSVALQRFHFFNIGNILGGFLIFVYALNNLNYTPSLTEWGIFLMLIIVSFVVFYSFFMIVASLVFRLERLESLWSLLTFFTEPITVPFDIFPRVPRLLITYLIPIAFIVFVPAQAITGRLALWQLPLAIVMAIICLTLANLAWSSGLKRYTSASS